MSTRLVLAALKIVGIALPLSGLVGQALAQGDETAPQYWATFADELKSGGFGPRMIGVNGGRFRMGCVSGVACSFNEPVRDVIVAPFALSIHKVTRGDFRLFVEQTGYVTEAERAPKSPYAPGFGSTCASGPPNVPGSNWGHTWKDPGFQQTDDHPVVCVSWAGAQEYVRWLAAQTDRPYRLPSEAEWEYAARAGAPETVLSDEEVSRILYCASLSKERSFSWEEVQKCKWTYSHTQAVGAFQPNAFGIYAMTRNAEEWVEDCWHRNFRGAPEDGSAWGSKNCRRQVVRVGEHARLGAPVEMRNGLTKRQSLNLLGFRVALPQSD